MTVTVRAPRYATNREIERIVREKEPWIRKQLEKIAGQKEMATEQQPEKLTEKDIRIVHSLISHLKEKNETKE